MSLTRGEILDYMNNNGSTFARITAENGEVAPLHLGVIDAWIDLGDDGAGGFWLGFLECGWINSPQATHALHVVESQQGDLWWLKDSRDWTYYADPVFIRPEESELWNEYQSWKQRNLPYYNACRERVLADLRERIRPDA